MSPSPVILQTEVHCAGCARRIRRAVKHLQGVENVWASPDTGLVVASGWADAWALKRRMESSTRRPVTVACDGAEEAPCRSWSQVLGYPPPSHVGSGTVRDLATPYYPAPYHGGWWY